MVESKNYLVIILSKSKNNYCESLSNSIDSIIIYDKDIPDQLLKEKNFCCLTETVKKVSAWDKAFHYLHNNLELINKYDYFYFIEDDVYTNNFETLNNLFNILYDYNHDLIAHDIASQEKSRRWNWWRKYRKNRAKSYNPICRLSKKILRLVVNYFIENKKLLFHEVLFASIADEHKLDTLDFKTLKEYKNIFGVFRYRPILNIKNIKDNRIYHPVKPIYENI